MEAVNNYGREPQSTEIIAKSVTSLHLACWHGYVPLAKVLIDYGADINANDGDHWTPLHWACFEGHKAVVELLVDRGATIDAIDPSWETPLLVASQRGYHQIAQVLLENEA